MKIGTAALRVPVGTLFVGHGLQKLGGMFGGHGLDATGAAFEQLGLRPGKPHAVAAGLSEAVGGALLATGLLTPIGASMTTGAMAVAIAKVHAKNGVWATSGGFEYNLVLTAASFAIAADGPGELSLDHALGIERSGPAVAFAALAAGVAGAALVVLRANRAEPAQEAADPASNGDLSGQLSDAAEAPAS
jgi:putative oxidoreductase